MRAFASTAAVEIRAKGEAEAAPWLEKLKENPEHAVFLRNLDFIRNAVTKRATLVLPMDMPGLQLFAPDALNGLQPGEIPGKFDQSKVGSPKSGDADNTKAPEGRR